MELFWSAFFLDFLAFVLNTERYGVPIYSVGMRENPGKMRTRITPNTDSFYAVVVFVTLISRYGSFITYSINYFRLFTIDEPDQVKIFREIIQHQGYFFKIAYLSPVDCRKNIRKHLFIYFMKSCFTKSMLLAEK